MDLELDFIILKKTRNMDDNNFDISNNTHDLHLSIFPDSDYGTVQWINNKNARSYLFQLRTKEATRNTIHGPHIEFEYI
jgi:hypothetical protein